ncbi:Unknown protein [Striga hermonthica]|uniref:BED-type domain-containing protein n=1 Tax=Striga hermonthica TaxID=68872 RepID=A0A9N7MJA3_STRHE|nr:Unknown protein [Striga hermonthica]
MESQSVSSSNLALSTNVNVTDMKDGDNQTQESSKNTNVSQKSNPKKRKDRSIAWNHCERTIIQDDEGNEEMFAICKHCELQMPADSKRNGTRGLLNHLYYRCEKYPLRVVMDKSQPTLTQSMMGGEVKISDFNQKRLDMMCVKWIVKAEMPFRTVEQPDFKEFIHDLQPRYKIPNRRKIAKDGEDIGRCLEEKLVEWGISKVFTITVDNASSNDVAVEYLKKQLRKHDSLMLDENLHMRCACHIINLIVKDGMKELVDSIEAIRNCVKYIHSSSARLDKFREYAVLEKKDKMSTIPMDVVTRWNATYIMLHGAYKFKGVFARLVEEFTPFKSYFEEGRVGPPSDEDWEKAMGFAHFLKKFYDATVKLSATKTPTSHLVLKILINLKIEIEARIRDKKNIVLQNVATSMKRKFDKYWGSFEDMNILMFVAQTLDPRYKFQLMELQLGELGYSLNEVEHLKSRVKAHLYLMYETYKGSEKPHVNVHEDGDDGVDLGDDDDIDDDDVELRIERRLNRQRKEAKLKEIANEVDKYFNDAYESTKNDDFDLLRWWKSKISSYSILSKIAKDVLAFPSSTVASEYAFSLGGRIVDPFRASLTSRMVEALVCTNDWLRGEEFQFHKEPTEEELEFYMELEQLEQSIPNTNEMPPPRSKSANPPESGVNKLSSHPSRGGKGGRGCRSNRGGRGGGATSSSKLIDEE